MEEGLRQSIRSAVRADDGWVLPLFTKNKGTLGNVANSVWYRYWQSLGLRHHWLVIPELAFVHYRIRLDGVRVIDEIAVDERAKRQGLGRMLVEAVGAPCELKTDINNEESNAFYRGLGFYPAGVKVSKDGKKTMRIWRKS